MDRARLAHIFTANDPHGSILIDPQIYRIMNKRTKITILDNDTSLEPVYRHYLKDNDRYELLGFHSSVQELLSSRERPDIILCETQVHGISGLDGLEYFQRKDKDLKVLMVSAKNDFKLIREAFNKGASGYLLKPLGRERLLGALDALQLHGLALEHEVAKKIISSFQSRSFDSFSKKENQIIELLTQGFTYKMIADRLCVTPSAVNFHIQNIYVKLNVNSKSEALKKLKEMEFRQLDAA